MLVRLDRLLLRLLFLRLCRKALRRLGKMQARYSSPNDLDEISLKEKGTTAYACSGRCARIV
jgi:hypothetical protein